MTSAFVIDLHVNRSIDSDDPAAHCVIEREGVVRKDTLLCVLRSLDIR